MTDPREVAVAAEARAKYYRSLGNRTQRTQQARGLPRFHDGDPDLRQLREPTFQARVAVDRDAQGPKLVRWNGVDRYHFTGYATVFETWYEMYDFFGPYEESVATSALDVSLDAGPDVAFLENHRGLTMARTISTASGIPPSLVIAANDHGLSVEAWTNPKRTDVTNLAEAIAEESITEMSFAFWLEEGWWNDDFTRFIITKADIDRGDVSAVNFGANPYTNIGVRAAELIGQLEMVPLSAARAALTVLQRRVGDRPVGIARTVTDQVQSAESDERDDKPTGRSVAMIEALLGEDATIIE